LQVREDPVFRREGSDIHVDTVLSITQVMFLNEEIIDTLACVGTNFHDCFCFNFLFSFLGTLNAKQLNHLMLNHEGVTVGHGCQNRDLTQDHLGIEKS